MSDLHLPSGSGSANSIKPVAPAAAGVTPLDVRTPVPVRAWPYANLMGGVLATTSGITAVGMVLVVMGGAMQRTAGAIAGPNLHWQQTQPAGQTTQPAAQPTPAALNPPGQTGGASGGDQQ